ncbi:TPA: hypothetical protein ACYU77_002985 [Klebsiella variicola subsp. variicola]
MTSREQFEAWLEREQGLYGEDIEWQPERNCYAKFGIHLAWCAWQESRNVEIELPSIEDKKWYSSWHGKFREEAFWLEVKRRLVKLGLKVKGG